MSIFKKRVAVNPSPILSPPPTLYCVHFELLFRDAENKMDDAVYYFEGITDIYEAQEIANDLHNSSMFELKKNGYVYRSFVMEYPDDWFIITKDVWISQYTSEINPQNVVNV